MRRPEAQEYLDKASERLRAGRLLLREKLFDDAASRAYYGALSAAKAALAQDEILAKSHDGAILLFGKHFVKTGRAPRFMATNLARLRTMREKAEYSGAFTATEKDAQWSMEAAERFVAEIEKLLPYTP